MHESGWFRNMHERVAKRQGCGKVNTMDSTIKPLADAIYADKVRRARVAPLTQKMGWGAELFNEACERMRDGIRAQFPQLSREEVETTLLHRLNRLRQVHEHGIYQKAPARP